MRCCVTCLGHRSRRWHRSSFQPTAQPLVVGGVCRSWDWPGGWTAQGALQVRPCKLGRRLLVRAVLHARQGQGWASCPTRPRHASGPCGSRPCAAHPPGHGQFPCASTTEKKEKIKSGSGSLRYARSEPSMARLWRTSVRGKLSKAGWVGWRGCEPHGCGDQASMDGFTASPAIRPTPPTRSNPAVAVAVALLPLQVQGCKPCKTTTSPNLQSPATRGSPATAAASATPGSSHHAGPAAAATPATAPPRCNRARPRAARR